MRLHHVSIAMPAGAGDRARAFYGGLLGLSEIDRPALLNEMDLVWFDLGLGRQLHLFAAETVGPQPGAHMALASMEYDGLIARLEQAQVAAKHDESWLGQRRCFVRDPFGNLIELMDDSTLSWGV
jgi:catechol 2,3-dioxygenase-like lactoylglutathione lyase family enzyme